MSSTFVRFIDSAPDLGASPTGPLQKAFLARVQSAIGRVLRDASEAQLAEALAAPSDVGTVARALSEIGTEAVRAIDPLAPAVARQIEHRTILLEQAGEMLSADQAGQILGISRQAVDKRRRGGKLLALNIGSDWAYPAFQFADHAVLPGIPEVVTTMAQDGPWMTLDLLLAPDTALGGRSLLDVLRAGEHELAARIMRQQAGDGFA